MRHHTLALLLLLLCYGAIGATSTVLAQEMDDEATIRQANEQMFEAVNEGDMTVLFQIVDSSASNFVWTGAPLEKQLDPKGLRDAYGAGMTFDVTTADMDVHIFDNAAFVTGYFTGTYTPAHGEAEPLNVRATTVWIKRDGEWKVVHLHQSPLASAGREGQ